MSVKSYKPKTASLRFIQRASFEELTKKKRPERKLLKGLKKSGGRNNLGRVTSRHRGGGHKRRYRLIDFKQIATGASVKIRAIEYDPNRSSRIALVENEEGKKAYILAVMGMKAGDVISVGEQSELNIGNRLPLSRIPAGMAISNIELVPGKGGQIVRSAGSSAVITAKEGDYANVKLPSGEIRKISVRAFATLGQMSNPDHMNVSIGKAGRSRHKGIRPWSRAVVKNPVDHPMGGGEGKSSGGRHPCSRSGRPAKGGKTRRNKLTNKYIVKRRKK